MQQVINYLEREINKYTKIINTIQKKNVYYAAQGTMYVKEHIPKLQQDIKELKGLLTIMNEKENELRETKSRIATLENEII